MNNNHLLPTRNNGSSQKRPPPDRRLSSSSSLSRRRKQKRQQDATMKRTFYLWVLLVSCFMMVMIQFRITRKVVRTSTRNSQIETSSPYFWLPNYFITTTVGDNEEEDIYSSNNKKKKMNKRSLKDDESGEDDAILDDDNQFDDDTNVQQQQEEDEGEGDDNNDNKQGKPPLVLKKQDTHGQGDEITLQEQQYEATSDLNYETTREQRLQDLKQKLDQDAEQNGGQVNGALLKEYREELKLRLGRNTFPKPPGNDGSSPPPLRFDPRKGRYRNRFKSSKPEMMYWKPPNVNQDFSKYPILPEERILPDMNTPQGGVIFFLHVPKTGGQTIRQLNLKFRKHLHKKNKGEEYGRFAKQLMARKGKKTFPKDASDAWQKTMKKREYHQQQQHQQQQQPRVSRKLLEATIKHNKQLEWKATTKPKEQKELEDLTRHRLRYVAANTLDVFQQQAIPQINNYFNGIIANNKTNKTYAKKVLFVEVHGMDNYHATELEPYLHYWREQSKKTGIPFFAFTLLREAISLQVSFFNYYYIHPGDPRFCDNPLKPESKCGDAKRKENADRRAEYKRKSLQLVRLRGEVRRGEVELTEEVNDTIAALREELLEMKHKKNHANGIPNATHAELERTLVQVAYENPQCLFLARGERTFGDGRDEKRLRNMKLKRTDCQQVYLSMQRSMDWIGRTDTMSTETLPLLTKMMFGKAELGGHLPKANVSPIKGGYVKMPKLSESARKALEQKSQLDQELYHRALEDYAMDQWVNKTTSQ